MSDPPTHKATADKRVTSKGRAMWLGLRLTTKFRQLIRRELVA
jgi:hypothetical protein